MTQVDDLVKRARLFKYATLDDGTLAHTLADALEAQAARVKDLELCMGEAYQAVGMLIETIGVDGDENIVRLQDVLSYGATEDGKELLPFPLLPNVRAEKAEARIAALEAQLEALREALEWVKAYAEDKYVSEVVDSALMSALHAEGEKDGE